LSTVYGPVPSWRFGRSLGIDVISPPKKCTFNCVYCQLGKTLISVSEQREIHETISAEQVLDDLDRALKRIDLDSLDTVTFSGTGEPTLNSNLKIIANGVRERIDGIPMVILTNASLFHRRNVRKALEEFDMVVAKLDAGDNETFHSINRPTNRKLNIDSITNSIKRVGREVEGRLALEIMLLDSNIERITNTEGNHLQNLLDAIFEIDPDIVQLLIPYRPPSESYVRVPPPETVEFISNRLSERLGKGMLWVYSLHDRRGKAVRRLSLESLDEDVIELLKRRPCRSIDISLSLGVAPIDAKQLLERLGEKHLVVSERRGGENYYSFRE
jgi:wyosine [tRNA(Phe)-imidazoG37] synthetase (radical SAM superfamily)